MLIHYIKIAFRSYLNNKTQSLITLFSLAVSFAFVSLAAYWTHYEQTYDSFLDGYKNIYLIGKKVGIKIDNHAFYGLYSQLMSNYAEVDKACAIQSGWRDSRKVEINNHTIQAGCERITPETIDIFEIQWVEGNQDVDSWKENEVAICEEIARKVCGKDSPIGVKLSLKDPDGIETEREYQIAAVFKTWPQHSNFNFRILKNFKDKLATETLIFNHTYVRLNPNTNLDLFLQKLNANPFKSPIPQIKDFKTTYNVLTPLSDIHYLFPKVKRNIRMNEVNLFAGAAMLLSICALLNYLTLFISRLRNRGRDMALRTICGSSS